MKYCHPKIGVCGRHRCFPGGDVGRRQQQGERKGRRADAEEEKGERERGGRGIKKRNFFCGVGPTCGSWYVEGYRVWMGAEEGDIEQRILMTTT